MDHDQSYPDGFIEGILDRVRTIAVVGASPDPSRPSHEVMSYLIKAGYEVFPVNPMAGVSHILDRPVVGSLGDLERAVDMVDVFRDRSALLDVARQAVAADAGVLWGQLGVFDAQAARLAEDAGLDVVMNRCPKIELRRMGR